MHLAGYLLGILHYICLPFVILAEVPQQQLVYYLACQTNNDNNNNARPPSFDVINRELDSNGVCDDTMTPTTSSSSSKSTEKIGNTIAIILCIYFQYEQYKHHVLLANLRSISATKSKSSKLGSTSSKAYSIPNRRWFEYVSCPHYLCEIMIYFMFALLLENNKCSIIDNGDDAARVWIDRWSHCNFDISSSLLWPGISRGMVAMYKSRQWILFVWVGTNLSLSASRSHDWYRTNFRGEYPLRRKRLIPFVW